LRVYPEISSTISESWQAEKWLNDVDLDELSPMWADWKHASHRHFYVKEVAQTRNGEFVIPMRWIIYEKQEQVECYRVQYNEEVSRFLEVSSNNIF